MAEVQIAVKDISYSFPDSEMAYRVRSVAEEDVRQWYEDEQEFQLGEFEAMKENGEVETFDDYRRLMEMSESSVDYSKDFEENKNHPAVLRQTAQLTEKYLCNVYDLPNKAVVTLDDSFLDDKGRPDESEVRRQLSEKYGVPVTNFGKTSTAAEKDVYSQFAYDKTGDMIKELDFEKFMAIRANIGKYSSNNIVMIYGQNPDAKAVMSFNAWKNNDRCVSKGEHSIKIWQPSKRAFTSEQQIDKFLNTRDDYFNSPYPIYVGGKAVSGKTLDEKKADFKDKMMDEIAKHGKGEILTGYNLGNVFDISQTESLDPEHDNYDLIAYGHKLCNAELENYAEIADAVESVCNLVPTAVNDPPDESKRADAVYDSVEGYAESVFSQMPEKINGIKSGKPSNDEIHRAEVAISAYLITQHIGIDSGERASSQLAEIFRQDKLTDETIRTGRREMFTKAFDRACKLADQVNGGLDKFIEQSREMALENEEDKKPKVTIERD